MSKRKLSPELKVKTIAAVKANGMSVASAALEFDVSESVLRRWIREQPDAEPFFSRQAHEEVLFDGTDIRIVVSHHGSDAVVVSFSPRPQRPGDNLRGFGRDFFDGQGVTGVYVVALWANWWQSPEMDTAIEAVRRSGIVANSPHSLAYGGSMGGFAALNYATRFECKHALVVSPQVTIEPADILFETRWADDRAKLILRDPDSRTGLGMTCHYTVIFDPFDSGDARHVALLPDHARVQLVPLPLCSHSPLMLIKEIGYLKELVLQSIKAPPDIALLRRRVREGRRRSPTYFAGLAQVAARHKHMALARWAAGARFDKDYASPGGFYAYAKLLAAEGLNDQLLQAAERHLAANPQSRQGLVQRRNALLRLDRPEEALIAAETLVKQKLSLEDDWRAHAVILNRLRRGHQARLVTEAAIRRYGKTPHLLCCYIEAAYHQRDWEKVQELYAEMVDDDRISDAFKAKMAVMMERLQ